MSDEPPRLVRISGGLPGEPRIATIGRLQIERDDGETLAEFEARATAQAEAIGVPGVIIGGLPAAAPLDAVLAAALVDIVRAYAERSGRAMHVAAADAAEILAALAAGLAPTSLAPVQ